MTTIITPDLSSKLNHLLEIIAPHGEDELDDFLDVEHNGDITTIGLNTYPE
jgi:hypothetical protein